MSKVREDKVVPYHHFPAKPRGEASSMISQSLPMAAMFMRNKMLSWAAVFLAVQSYLNEPTNKPSSGDEAATQPPLLRVVLAIFSLGTCYLDLLFPAVNPQLRAAQAAAAAATAAATA
ncbi:hypothetical protein PSN45_000238 [Yamadazyma tenuis]|uniref:Uncharacterized protein n=1 Tax=Candida tenuis (strain ATCC 10573 / BCRC 21748 / CBS 615 / JCM 9827 / NBRC 10315 / NRRL Y-1498 / VKM Y-70) TaxID=590646 RepID=G3BBK4_CANTC|nr:uncharacterized protein CANTEDRAFT_115026 [Yamadazyma tenuis ATCC 10573]EGV61559.1 hypothetical protein CANTEDRAFT_115026 [Yamadazyma tenuis ATCC 10573]WEJ92782.1 hypothetical protein PSN45_000238 [Yamadazyma tenuis]